jgi:hypothetical protein
MACDDVLCLLSPPSMQVSAKELTALLTKPSLQGIPLLVWCYLSHGHVMTCHIFFCPTMQVSAKELMALLTKPSLQGIPLLVLGNKNDLPGALGTQQLIERMGLQVRGRILDVTAG